MWSRWDGIEFWKLWNLLPFHVQIDWTWSTLLSKMNRLKLRIWLNWLVWILKVNRRAKRTQNLRFGQIWWSQEVIVINLKMKPVIETSLDDALKRSITLVHIKLRVWWLNSWREKFAQSGRSALKRSNRFRED